MQLSVTVLETTLIVKLGWGSAHPETSGFPKHQNPQSGASGSMRQNKAVQTKQACDEASWVSLRCTMTSALAAPRPIPTHGMTLHCSKDSRKWNY